MRRKLGFGLFVAVAVVTLAFLTLPIVGIFVHTTPGKVSVIKIPAWAQPKVQYGICVVSTSSEKPAAHAFIKRVLSKAGQKKLHKYGFLARVKQTHHKKKR